MINLFKSPLVIEFKNNGRTFFVNETFQRTWSKDHALQFDTVSDAMIEIKNNTDIEYLIRSNYKIIKLSKAKSH
jgi:hypothetical protein